MITPALGLTCYEPADIGTKGDCTTFITKFCTSIAGALVRLGHLYIIIH
jgi:hypothetical protein